MHDRVIVTALLLSAMTGPAGGKAVSDEKKLILIAAKGEKQSFAGVNSEFIRHLEESPFDGTTYYPSARHHGTRLQLSPFNTTITWELEGFRGTINRYRKSAALFKRCTENFLYIYAVTGNKKVECPDWFDDEAQEIVLNNWTVLAAICKESGLKGFVFDDEMYYGDRWNYKSGKYTNTHTAAEYYDQAFLRGARIMKAMSEVFPDIKIMFLHGSDTLGKGSDPARRDALKFAFMDGLLSQCTGQAEIIEGWELAYGYRAEPSFAAARRFLKEDLLSVSRVPEKFRRHSRMAYGIWGDFGADVMKFDDQDILNNWRTPDEMAWTVHCALKHSDRYVWVWNHSMFWLYQNPQNLARERGQAGEAYREAMRRARRDLPGPSAPRGIENLRHRIPHRVAHKEEGYDDEATFGALWQDYTLLSRLNHVWHFRTDPLGAGVREKWYQVGLDLSRWGHLRSGMYWNEQGLGFYDGYGWYRQSFVVPPVPAGKKVFLAFGAIRHSADVYVNGKRTGRYNENPDPRQHKIKKPDPFLVDITEHVNSGRANELTVRVLDLGGRGSGMWKDVLLVAEKFEATVAQRKARDQMTLRAHVPRYWKFKVDPENKGEKGKWHAPGFDDAEWDRIAIDRIWTLQKGYAYYDNAKNPDIQGRAWYRAWIDVPADFQGRKVYVGCRGLDHKSEIYVNGKPVGTNDNWKRPFEFEVTSVVNPGQRSIFAVRIIEGVGIYGKFEVRAAPRAGE